MIIKLIVKALKSLFSFLKKHPKAVITTAAGIGTAIVRTRRRKSTKRLYKSNKKHLINTNGSIRQHNWYWTTSAEPKKMSSILFHVMPIP